MHVGALTMSEDLEAVKWAPIMARSDVFQHVSKHVSKHETQHVEMFQLECFRLAEEL